MRTLSILVAVLLLASAALAQTQQPYHEVRIVIPDRSHVPLLTEVGEIDHMRFEEISGGLAVLTTIGDAEMRRVVEAGYSVEILLEDIRSHVEARSATCPAMPPSAPEGFFFGSMGCFPTLVEAIDAIDGMRAARPDIVGQKFAIGFSWEGRPIWGIRFTTAADPEAVPQVLYTSLHHAREPGSLAALLYFMYYLLENYGTDEEVTYLLDNRALFFFPILNPDGYVYNQAIAPGGGGMWRKNRRDHPSGGSSIGVDLNRNYAYQWGGSGSSNSPSSQIYRGPYPFSEPELAALRSWLTTRNIRAAYNYHTFGQYWLHPFGFGFNQYTPDHAHFTALSAEITQYNSYTYGTAANVLYVASGTSDDWMYGEQGEKPKTMAWTPEMGTSFWPHPVDIVPISQQGLHPNLVLAHAAGPWLRIEDVEIGETVEGNGHLDPGEEGTVSVTLFNRGLSDVDDARARVVSENPALGVEPGPWSGFFSLSSFAEIEVPDLHFTLGPEAPLGRHDGLRIEVEADGTLTPVELGSLLIGTPVVVFEDAIDNGTNWELGDWGLTAYAYSPPYALADSPGANYPNNADNALTLAEPLDLSYAEAPFLRFMARWDIETSFDFVQVLASTDGSTWTPLHGRHTRLGSGQGVQPAGQPGYDGTQGQWIEEEMSLAAFAGESAVSLRWHLRSNATNTAQGFFLDDVEVIRMTDAGTVSTELDATPTALRLDSPFPNPSSNRVQIGFGIDRAGTVELAVYDVLGRRVATLAEGPLEAGSHRATWDASGAASGVYVLRLSTGFGEATRRVTVAR